MDRPSSIRLLQTVTCSYLLVDNIVPKFVTMNDVFGNFLLGKYP